MPGLFNVTKSRQGFKAYSLSRYWALNYLKSNVNFIKSNAIFRFATDPRKRARRNSTFKLRRIPEYKSVQFFTIFQHCTLFSLNLKRVKIVQIVKIEQFRNMPEDGTNIYISFNRSVNKFLLKEFITKCIYFSFTLCWPPASIRPISVNVKLFQLGKLGDHMLFNQSRAEWLLLGWPIHGAGGCI